MILGGTEALLRGKLFTVPGILKLMQKSPDHNVSSNRLLYLYNAWILSNRNHCRSCRVDTGHLRQMHNILPCTKWQTSLKLLPLKCRQLHLNTSAAKEDEGDNVQSKSLSRSSSTPIVVEVTQLVSDSHINILAKILECSAAKIQLLMSTNSFLIHMDPDLIHSKVQIIKSYNIPMHVIHSNLRVVYQSSCHEIERRFDEIQSSGLLYSPFLSFEQIPHLLECTSTEFKRALGHHCNQRDALEGCPDKLTYLQMRLGCEEKAARGLLHSYPLERGVSNTRLKSLLDFLLLEAGRSPAFVITYRKLFAFAVGRLRSRWKIMQCAGVEGEEEMVWLWCITQKEFEKRYSEYMTGSKTES